MPVHQQVCKDVLCAMLYVADDLAKSHGTASTAACMHGMAEWASMDRRYLSTDLD